MRERVGIPPVLKHIRDSYDWTSKNEPYIGEETGVPSDCRCADIGSVEQREQSPTDVGLMRFFPSRQDNISTSKHVHAHFNQFAIPKLPPLETGKLL